MRGEHDSANSDVDLGHVEAYGREPVQPQEVDPAERQTALVLNVVFLISGLFFFPIWAAGFFYRKHADPTVQILAKINMALFLLFLLLTICFFIVFIILAVVSLVLLLVFFLVGAAGVSAAAH